MRFYGLFCNGQRVQLYSAYPLKRASVVWQGILLDGAMGVTEPHEIRPVPKQENDARAQAAQDWGLEE